MTDQDPVALLEPENAGGDHDVDPDLVELHEVLEWEAAVAAAEGGQ